MGRMVEGRRIEKGRWVDERGVREGRRRYRERY